ncbi:MAG: PEGA domain-containing protein, partial [Puniceicoccales bacterium]
VKPTEAHSVAIFVKNRAGSDWDDATEIFQDYLISRLADMDFAIVTPDDTVYALGDGYQAQQMDNELKDGSSMLRLAQNLDVDYVLVAAIDGMTQEKRQFEGYGTKTMNDIYRARVSYRLLDAPQGGSMTGSTVTVSEQLRQTPNSSVASNDIYNSLLDKAAVKVSEALGQQKAKGRIKPPAEMAKPVPFSVVVGIQDLSIPDVIDTGDGTYQLSSENYSLEGYGVTVELDGIAIGTATGKLVATPGLHRMRLTRPGYEPWEKNVKVYDGLTMTVTMRLSENERQRWMQNSQFLNNLRAQSVLTDAEVERIKGMAQALRQSGMRIDYRTDTDLPITINPTQSIFSQGFPATVEEVE